ncbi:MFS transporter [Rickettsia bellii]|uniref:MFS-type transporter n=1 Tax=Rickettsia bellii (strain RML369-C) TaxID=336407 RepID=Q1RIR9_RICBR|nr:MFS transporter [Rickettsia bellii]ABE04745.1 MFS-type transporter [Rickettsia bellii RML369-C]
MNYFAAAFCSTYLLRPVGAIIFGWIGDNIGRKTTVIITTAMMSLSCVVMATFPTYAQIGVAVAWVITICRIVQGMSCMGEIIGSELYITEITSPPIQYTAVAIISIFTAFGSFAALAIAYYSTKYCLNWRIAFWGGAVIAIVGAVARTHLRETPEFIDAKRQLKKKLEQALEKAEVTKKQLENSAVWKEKVNNSTSLAVFLLQCAWPVCFYIIYFHCGNIMKNNFGFTSEEIIHQNFIVSIFQIFSFIIWTYLSYRMFISYRIEV